MVWTGTIYKHPALSKTDFTETYLRPLLDKLNKENKMIALMGDFKINLRDSENNNEISNFIDTLSSNFVFPTRIWNQSETLIDNIFTNTNKHNIRSGNLNAGISDHLPQFTIFESIKHNPKPEQKYYKDWRSFNSEEFLNSFKKEDWKKRMKLEKRDPNFSFEIFLKKTNELIEKHVPTKKLTKKTNKE